MSRSSALPIQPTDEPARRHGAPQITDWAKVRRELSSIEPVARQLRGNGDVKIADPNYLTGSIGRAVESVVSVCQATGRKIDLAIADSANADAAGKQFLPRLTELLRALLCLGSGNIQINASRTFDPEGAVFCVRIAGMGLEVSDEARLCLLALAHTMGATTSILTAKTESAVALNIPVGRTAATSQLAVVSPRGQTR